MSLAGRLCAVIPTYNNPLTVAQVVREVRRHIADVIVVDDGGDEPARQVLDRLARDNEARVIRRERNGGKGAAVKTGLEEARAQGFSHAMQIDADGQHETDDLPRFLTTSATHPTAAVLGHPVFDDSTPRGRRAAHAFTNFWTRLETAGPVIVDPQCGFRVYPVAAACAAARASRDHMDFDIEIAVRLVWAGVPIVNLPTRVRYLPAAQGGISHFRPWGDNLAISWAHTRLVVGSLLWRLRRPRRALPELAP